MTGLKYIPGCIYVQNNIKVEINVMFMEKENIDLGIINENPVLAALRYAA